jgi:hypothetical protein
MTQENQDANLAGSSPADSHIDTQNAQEDREPILGTPIESADLVSTTEFEVVDNSAQGDNSQASADEGDSDGSSKSADEKLTPEEMKKLDATFQDSPRFQELQKEKTALKASQIKSDAQIEALTNQVQTLTNLVQGKGDNTQQANNQNQGPAFTDVLEMSDEKIIEAFETDPKAFLANYAVQLESEITGKLIRKFQNDNQQAQAQTQEQAIKDLYAQYETDNPDFVIAWEDGSIQEYMQKNPGLTPIGAHKLMKTEGKTLTSEEQQKATDEAVAKAVAEAEKNFATKHKIRVIPAGGGNNHANSDKTPPDLANTKQHGGLTAVLARRLAARKAAN